MRQRTIGDGLVSRCMNLKAEDKTDLSCEGIIASGGTAWVNIAAKTHLMMFVAQQIKLAILNPAEIATQLYILVQNLADIPTARTLIFKQGPAWHG